MAPQTKKPTLLCGGNQQYGRARLRRDPVDDLSDSQNEWFTDRPIKWMLYDTIVGFDKGIMENIIESALSKWAAVSSLTFEKAAPDTAADDVNLKIKVSGPSVVDPDFPAQTDGSWIAANASWGPGISQLWKPVEKKIYSAHVKFNNTSSGPNNWNVNQIHNVFLHEVGHALKLGHTLVEGAVMGRLMKEGGGNQDIQLQSDDIARIQKYYKPASAKRRFRRAKGSVSAFRS
ncbi:hypothetical protein TWF730_004242 [Orbilia blumenaviensis]|uniref:Peptidase M10 metallopeptidase domain-containing protein n=1 Tax=Orbilia blumenaviensis TaxID=1796055 RepID=A0AAV9U2A4_9PEZI